MEDLDGDDVLDMVSGNTLVTQGVDAPSIAWKNDGAGVFTTIGTAATGSLTESIALGDLDGDDDPDLLEGNYNGGNRVWMNDGAGVFAQTGQWLGLGDTMSVVLGDLDLVTGNDGANLVWKNMGAGIFTDTGQLLGSLNTDSVGLGDVDGDGDPDIVVGNRDGPNRIYINMDR